jgi:hypothetical protein
MANDIVIIVSAYVDNVLKMVPPTETYKGWKIEKTQYLSVTLDGANNRLYLDFLVICRVPNQQRVPRLWRLRVMAPAGACLPVRTHLLHWWRGAKSFVTENSFKPETGVLQFYSRLVSSFTLLSRVVTLRPLDIQYTRFYLYRLKYIFSGCNLKTCHTLLTKGYSIF